MANTLTNLIPTMYSALDVVSRELVGFIPAVSRNSGVERAALNQSVRVPIAPAPTLANNTPAVNAPDTGDHTIGSVEMLMSKSMHAPIRWNGEEQLAMTNAGTVNTILQDQFTQAFRALCNEIESDLAGTYTDASRAYGTAGSAPFGTAGDLSDVAGVRQILDDNGAPQTDLQLVLGSAAMANIRGKQSVLFKANEAGTDDLLRRGTLGMLEGFAVHNSAQTSAHTAGAAVDTSPAYLVDTGETYAIGSTTVHLDAGTGAHSAGDVITFAGDPNKYVISATVAGNGDKDIVLNAPGLRMSAANDIEATVGASYRANMAFSRSAIVLATRLPARPSGGDSADDVMTITDPVTGLAFEVAIYRQYRQIVYHVSIAWGWKAIKPEHIAVLLG